MELRHYSQEDMPASEDALTSLSRQSDLADAIMSDTNARSDATSSETDSLTALLQKEARHRRKELSGVAVAAAWDRATTSIETGG